MIDLGNGHVLDVVLDSGSLGLSGLGWPSEWPALVRRQLRPRELAAISKTVTLRPHRGNFCWWKPSDTVRYLGDGNWVNAFGLTNPGLKRAWPWLRLFTRLVGQPIISFFAFNAEEAAEIAERLNELECAAVELNTSCPNVNKPLTTDEINKIIKAARGHSGHPLLVKLSVDQDYPAIAERIEGLVNVLHFTNTVKWDRVYPKKPSPLARYGGGAVSGPDIHRFAVEMNDRLEESGIRTPRLVGGGVHTTAGALRLLERGAGAVAVATATHYNPELPHRIITAMREKSPLP